MARMTIGQKALRVVVFLLGLRHRQIAAALSRHGLTEEELAHGWTLVSTLTTGRLGSTQSENAALLAQLDEWENKWFPIVHAVLSTRHPAVRESVFRNLKQTSGPEVVVSVSTLLERFEQMARPVGEGGLGEEGRSARDLLVRRGLDAAAVAEARQLLDKLASIAAPETEPDDTWEAADAAAERALWDWYLEWGGIARAVISDRKLLKALGYLKSQSGEVTEDPEAVDHEEDGTDVPPASPTNGTPGVPGPFLPGRARPAA